jgi:hypothetical protein
MTTARPLPGHGTRACYLRGCRRRECATAHYRYMSRYRLQLHRSGPHRCDSAPAAAHVRGLLAGGWTQAAIARVAGCSGAVIRTLAHGRYATIRADIAASILRVPATQPPVGRYVDATGTVRRVRALVAIGHTIASIGAEAGISSAPLGVIAAGRRPQVETHTAQAVGDVYRRWSRTPGTSERARRHAARRGWHGPLAWGDDIDDPDALPEVDPGDLPLTTQQQARLTSEEIRHLGGFGISRDEIARRVGRSPSYVREQLAGRRGPGWRAQRRGEAA